MPDWKKTAQACLGICLDSQWGWHGWLYPVSKSLSFRLHQSRAWSNRITRTTRWYFAMAAFLAHRPTRSEVWSLRKWAKVKQWIFADCDPNQKKSKEESRWKIVEKENMFVQITCNGAWRLQLQVTLSQCEAVVKSQCFGTRVARVASQESLFLVSNVSFRITVSLSFAFEASCRQGLLAAEMQIFNSLGL